MSGVICSVRWILSGIFRELNFDRFLPRTGLGPSRTYSGPSLAILDPPQSLYNIARYGCQSHDTFKVINIFLYSYFITPLQVIILLILFAKDIYFLIFFDPKIGLNANYLETQIQIKIIQVI